MVYPEQSYTAGFVYFFISYPTIMNPIVIHLAVILAFANNLQPLQNETERKEIKCTQYTISLYSFVFLF